ncbi:hypothetical protein TIFTF001_046095 [Ficus carica]|uniref:Uncharacterized protein n=1 Tax=Ficus carica TaxID=3494 RepID=A0AA87ZMP0_FICCA|nr:hypothetical protein TIFTF001_046095 [Ficus carica]
MSDGDENTQVELQEMLVHALLKQPWQNSEDSLVYLYFYYEKFTLDPADRIYKEFSLFLKVKLPLEAKKMELGLHLSRGRSIMTKPVPSSVTQFDQDEADNYVYQI